MKQTQLTKAFLRELEESMKEHYKKALSESIKKGIRAKKAKICNVKNSKV